jgi:hypothetical protein
MISLARDGDRIVIDQCDVLLARVCWRWVAGFFIVIDQYDVFGSKPRKSPLASVKACRCVF